MSRYQQILVAVDGSDEALLALDEAIGIAKRNDAKLHIVYVNEANRTFLSDFNFMTDQTLQELENLALDKMDKYLQRSVELGVTNVKTYVKHGSAKGEIAYFEPEEGSLDLIVIGATGMNALERALAGSTTNYVVTHAKCPVLVIR